MRFHTVIFLLIASLHWGLNQVQAKPISSVHSINAQATKCAGALNKYFSYLQAGEEFDGKVQLEQAVDTLCQGVKLKLEKRNGILTGIVE